MENSVLEIQIYERANYQLLIHTTTATTTTTANNNNNTYGIGITW
jgi:hypothetical protein